MTNKQLVDSLILAAKILGRVQGRSNLVHFNLEDEVEIAKKSVLAQMRPDSPNETLEEFFEGVQTTSEKISEKQQKLAEELVELQTQNPPNCPECGAKTIRCGGIYKCQNCLREIGNELWIKEVALPPDGGGPTQVGHFVPMNGGGIAFEESATADGTITPIVSEKEVLFDGDNGP